MGSLSSKNGSIEYLSCVADAWVKPLKDKIATTHLRGFIEIVNESKHKPNNIWLDQGKEF